MRVNWELMNSKVMSVLTKATMLTKWATIYLSWPYLLQIIQRQTQPSHRCLQRQTQPRQPMYQRNSHRFLPLNLQESPHLILLLIPPSILHQIQRIVPPPIRPIIPRIVQPSVQPIIPPMIQPMVLPLIPPLFRASNPLSLLVNPLPYPLLFPPLSQVMVQLSNPLLSQPKFRRLPPAPYPQDLQARIQQMSLQKNQRLSPRSIRPLSPQWNRPRCANRIGIAQGVWM